MLLSMVFNSLYFYLWEGDFMLCKVLVWSLYWWRSSHCCLWSQEHRTPDLFQHPEGSWTFWGFVSFLKSWFFALRFITQVSPNCRQLISWQEAAALPLLQCWASPSGDITRRVWCFLSSREDNNCFPSVTQNYAKSLASIFAMSTHEILEDPCLNSH